MHKSRRIREKINSNFTLKLTVKEGNGLFDEIDG
jgi:hypothetical protein